MTSWYDRHLMPKLVGCACSARPIMRRRATLVPKASGRVLELGIGAGANLRFYDPARVAEVVGVDPSPEFARMAEAAPRAEGLRVRVESGRAECLPFPDSAFDTVVCTCVLCSVEDPDAVAQEARRVLKPGGRLLLLEHGRAPDRRVRRFQEKLEPTWSALAGGCRLTRDPLAALRAAGFRIAELEQRYLRKVPRFVGWTTQAIAERPG